MNKVSDCAAVHGVTELDTTERMDNNTEVPYATYKTLFYKNKMPLKNGISNLFSPLLMGYQTLFRPCEKINYQGVFLDDSLANLFYCHFNSVKKLNTLSYPLIKLKR